MTSNRTIRIGNVHLILAVVILAAVLAGCAGKTTSESAVQPIVQTACNAKDCFVSAANNCSNISIQVAEPFGTMRYSTSGCVFTKTVVNLSQNESADMRKALEGKSLSCVYEKGKFDSGLPSSLVAGIENCDGELKEIISQLVLFS